MADRFIKLGKGQTRSKLLAIVRLRDEIQAKKKQLWETPAITMQRANEAEELESRMKHFELLENAYKESIEKN